MPDKEFYTTKFTPNAAVANNGTMTVPYPTGATQLNFANAPATAVMLTNSNNTFTQVAGQLSVTYGASNITVTNSTGRALSAGVPLTFQFPTGSAAALSGVTGVTEIVRITQAAYDAIVTKNPTTLYVIVG